MENIEMMFGVAQKLTKGEKLSTEEMGIALQASVENNIESSEMLEGLAKKYGYDKIIPKLKTVNYLYKKIAEELEAELEDITFHEYEQPEDVYMKQVIEEIEERRNKNGRKKI